MKAPLWEEVAGRFCWLWGVGETVCPKGTPCARCVGGAKRLEGGSCRTGHPAEGRGKDE